METETISKNEASPKSQMSKENFLRKVCFAALTIVLCFAFVSCGKDDDGDSPSFSSSLTGTWKGVSYEAFDGISHFSGTNVEYAIVVFNGNGTGICTMDDGAKSNFNWELKGDLLSISSQYFNAVWKVIKLTPEEIIIDVWYDPEDTTGKYQHITYMKEIAPPNDNTARNLLVGTWVLTNYKGYYTYGGRKYDYDESYEVSLNIWLVFNSNGTFEDVDMGSGTWTYNNAILSLSANYERKYNVKKLTSTELVGEEDNAPNSFNTYTYTKIK